MLTVLLILATGSKLQLIMQDIKLIAATNHDLSTISRLAEVIWNQYYPAIISQAQIDFMLKLMYSAESLTHQISEKGHRFFLIGLEDNTIGFVSIYPENEHDLFLNKFYVNQEYASKGFGTQTFEAMKRLFKPKKITLTVNRQNFKAINFYFKCGFSIERVADFEIGGGYMMNDFVMVWIEQQRLSG
jgi:GNAT superfamily N-acetyltransferase